MNSASMNGVPGAGAVDRSRGAQDARKPAAADQTDENREVQGTPQDDGEAQAPVQEARDVYERTGNSDLVQRLTAEAAEEPEAPPREDRMDRARQRIAEGYYTSPDTTGRLADTLINTGVVK